MVSRDQEGTVRRPGETPGIPFLEGKRGHVLTRRRVPDPDDSVPTGRGQESSARRPNEIEDRLGLLVTFVPQQQVPGVGFPDRHARVSRGRGEPPTIW